MVYMLLLLAIVLIYHHYRSQISPDSHRYLNIPSWPATAGGGFLQVPRGPHLSWTRNIQSVCSKARKLIGLIYRPFYQHSSPPTDVFNAGSSTPRICKPSLEHI